MPLTMVAYSSLKALKYIMGACEQGLWEPGGQHGL